MTLKERISEFCKYAKIRISAFERRAGLSNGYFNQVKKEPSPSKLSQIEDAFPELNIDWLMTGQGSMLKENAGATQTDNIALKSVCAEETIANLAETVQRQSRQIEKLLNMVEHLQREQNIKEPKDN